MTALLGGNLPGHRSLTPAGRALYPGSGGWRAQQDPKALNRNPTLLTFSLQYY